MKFLKLPQTYLMTALILWAVFVFTPPQPFTSVTVGQTWEMEPIGDPFGEDRIAVDIIAVRDGWLQYRHIMWRGETGNEYLHTNEANRFKKVFYLMADNKN